MRYPLLGGAGLAWVLSLVAASANASSLIDDYLAAVRHEPNYAAEQMQSQNMLLDARQAAAAYLPRASLSYSQDAYDSKTRRTARIVQPIVSADRWLNMQESEPRKAIAGHLESLARYGLANRVFGAVRDLASTREKLSLHEANLTALQAQGEAARQAFELGLGTITDVLDTQVRVAQARAQIQRLQAELETSRRQYANVTGYLPAAGAYPMSTRLVTPAPLPTLDEMLHAVLQSNPSLQAQRQATELIAIGARRARAQFLPSINATLQRSQTGNNDPTNLSGVVISMDLPLQYGSQFALEMADNNLLAQQQKERATQAQLTLDTQRLYAQAQAAQQEVQISREAIDAAQLSLSANEQSFEGGVRSKIDVLNALQALLVAREAHLLAQLALAESLLGLQLLAANDIPAALQQIQALFFVPTP